MISQTIRITLIFLILVLQGITSAEAHSPHAIKVNTIKDPNGNPLIVEKLYGDGIFGPDPTRLQIRNRHGVVIARSTTDSSIFAFCPELQFCWAFHNAIGLQALKLDYKNLSYEKTDPASLSPGLKDYLLNTTYIHGSEADLSWPKIQDRTEGFIEINTPLMLLSPIIVLMDNIILFCIVAILFAIIFCIPFFIITPPRKNLLIMIILGCMFFGCTGLTSIIILFIYPEFFLYNATIAALSSCAGMALGIKANLFLQSKTKGNQEDSEF